MEKFDKEGRDKHIEFGINRFYKCRNGSIVKIDSVRNDVYLGDIYHKDSSPVSIGYKKECFPYFATSKGDHPYDIVEYDHEFEIEEHSFKCGRKTFYVIAKLPDKICGGPYFSLNQAGDCIDRLTYINPIEIRKIGYEPGKGYIYPYPATDEQTPTLEENTPTLEENTEDTSLPKWDRLGFTKDLKGTLNEDISRLYECKTPNKIE